MALKQLKYRFLILIVVGSIGVSSGVLAQSANPVLPLDPAVRMGKLSNGFTYYIRKNKTPEKRVVMYLANKVGAILETDQQRGLAHFIEHLSFNGTKHFPKNELVNYLEKSGVRFGADINANTGFDETVYQLPLPSDQPRLLENGLQIMRDWAQDALMETAAIDKERKIILEEKRAHAGLSQRMQQQSLPFLTNNSRYASRVPIGTEEIIRNVKPEEIRRFYRDWYRPNLQAILVVGDIDVAQMEQQIKAKFSDLYNPAKPKERTIYRSSLSGKNQFTQFIDPELTGSSIEVVIKHIDHTPTTVADYRKVLLKELIGQMLNGRYAELPLLSASVGFMQVPGGLAAFRTSVSTNPGDLENGLKTIWREIRRVSEQGFTQQELDRSKRSVKAGIAATLTEKDKTASENLLAMYLQHFLTGEMAIGVVKSAELSNQMLPEITLGEVNALVETYIKDTDRDIIVLMPEKDKAMIPGEKTVLSWINSVYTEKLQAFAERSESLPLLKDEPQPGKIVKVEDLKASGIQKITLSNGVNVVLKKTAFQNDQILFNGLSSGGNSLYPDSDYHNAANAGGIIAAGGAGNYNMLELGKLLTGRQVQVSPFINDTFQGFKGATTQEDLKTSLELLYAYFTEPRGDVNVFYSQVMNAKTMLANKGNSPSQVFMDTVNLVLGNYNPRKLPITGEQIDKLSLNRIYEIYKERFSDASGFTFTFVGNIDLVNIKPLLEKYLGALPSKNLNEKSRDLNIHIPEGQISKTIYQGKEQKSNVVLTYSGDFNYSYENTLKMNAIMEILKGRLLQRLREEEGGTYSPNVQMTTSKYPKNRFALIVSFDVAPQNVEKMIASVQDEIKQLRTAGPSSESIQKFKAESMLSMQTNLNNNDFWLNYLVGQQINKASLSQIFDHPTALNQVTVKSVQEAATAFIQDKNFVRLVLMPEQNL